ncbi:hypothetical protein KIW84_052517 [Lathyrus oleraceus]|uniref:Transposase-associated domain-containing protein n=1 Tax=Pisum sativum TaxID=3888 RepID=A0A9D4WNX2_PEA|nr:hypothetical protein KIW84_052517 [Pisum sativum]
MVLIFFLDYAYTKGNPRGKEILCPCANCYNTNWLTRNEVRNHLITFGFQKGYDVWVRHGEKKLKPGDLNDNYMNHEKDQIDDIYGLLHGRFRDVVQEENEVNVGLNEDAKKFYNLVEEAKQDLYPGCKNFSKLSFTVRLYLLKCLYGWSNISFNALLELLREAMPSLNIPDTFSKTKGLIRDLGLDYKKIDACPNDCMIYWKNHENDTSCHVWGAPRWNEDVKGDDKVEKSHNEHENKNPNKRKGWSKAKSQGLDFVEWFKKRALLSDVSENLRKLSRGPNEIAQCFSGYVINGYRFHTKYGMTCVYFNKRCYVDDPFVLASQVHQCFYIQDPSDANKHYVMKSILRDFFNMNEQSDSNLHQSYDCDLSDHAVNLASNDEICEVEFVRNDIPPTIFDNFVPVPDLIESDDDSNL